MNWDTLTDRLDHPSLPLAAPILASLGLFLLGWFIASPVEIRIDGDGTIIRTHARSVEASLRQMGWTASEGDEISPDLDSSLAGIEVVDIRRAQSVLVDIDGQVTWLKSASRWPENLLQKMEVSLLPGDQLWVDGLPYSSEAGSLSHIPSRVRLKRGSPIELVSTSGKSRTRAAEATVAETLVEGGYALFEGDRFGITPIQSTAGLKEIDWKPSRPISIAIGDHLTKARVAEEKVGPALHQAGVALLGLDFTQPTLDSNIPQDSPIRITRVREEVMVELEPVPFETQYQPLPDVEIDNQRVIETGSYGVRADQVRVRYENGEEVQRSVEGNWLAREPEPRVIGYGTNIVIKSTSTADGTIDYWRAVDMWATSYSPSRAGVPDDYEYFGITASGKRLEKGLVAIDRSLIPFGTRMYVPGYGFAEAADTGGGVKGLWIDLGYEDDNYEPWAQYVTVYFLTPVPPASSITYILP